MSDSEHSQQETADEQGVDPGMARHGGFSYVHIPAVDVERSASFYARVFGWSVHRQSPARAGFTDGTGRVGGAFVTDQAISREPGLLPYIYVNHIDETLGLVASEGGEVVRQPYAEGNLWVATIRDPAGNLIGVWQEGPR